MKRRDHSVLKRMRIALFVTLLLGFSPSRGTAQQLTLTWSYGAIAADGSNTHQGTEIFRQLETETTFGMIGSVNYPTASFVDNLGLTAGQAGSYKVSAYNARGISDFSNIACNCPGAPPPASTGTTIAAIDFGPPTSAVPTGYLRDAGLAYTAAKGFGWTSSWPYPDARARGVNPDERLDTFRYVGAGVTATWAYTLPNATYKISLASGDASYAQGPHRIVVEGIVAVNNLSTSANTYIIITDLPVTVSDGQLTVTLGGAGAGNTMLNYLLIKQ